MAIDLNPQQMAFKEAYLSPKSDTFGNAYKSAKKAGYAEEYAQSITDDRTEWVSRIVGDLKRLDKAEKALDEALSLDISKEAGERVDSNIVREKTKVAMFVAKGMAKEKYSERQEMTGPDGKDLTVQVVHYNDKT